MLYLVNVYNTLYQLLPEGVSCCIVDLYDELKGSTIIATTTKEVNKTEILRKMMDVLPNIALPRQFLVIEDLPMMGTGKIDFRSVTKIVEKMMEDSSKE